MKPYISLFVLLAFALLNSYIGEDSEYCPQIEGNSNFRLESAIQMKTVLQPLNKKNMD